MKFISACFILLERAVSAGKMEAEKISFKKIPLPFFINFLSELKKFPKNFIEEISERELHLFFSF